VARALLIWSVVMMGLATVCALVLLCMPIMWHFEDKRRFRG
jgi:hypothetical protein